MKYNLTKLNVQMLLQGKTLAAGRNRIRLPEDFQDRDILEKFAQNKIIREKYYLYIDTNDMNIYVMEKNA